MGSDWCCRCVTWDPASCLCMCETVRYDEEGNGTWTATPQKVYLQMTGLIDHPEKCPGCADHLNSPYPGIPFVLGYHRWGTQIGFNECIYRYTFGELWCGYDALEVRCINLGAALAGWIAINVCLVRPDLTADWLTGIILATRQVPTLGPGEAYRPYCDEFDSEHRLIWNQGWMEFGATPCSARMGGAQFELWMGN